MSRTKVIHGPIYPLKALNQGTGYVWLYMPPDENVSEIERVFQLLTTEPLHYFMDN